MEGGSLIEVGLKQKLEHYNYDNVINKINNYSPKWR